MSPAALFRFEPSIAGMVEAGLGLRTFLDAHGAGTALRRKAELVFDEVAANIVRHSGAQGPVELLASIELDGNLVLVFEDDGVPFDPVQRADPTLPRSLDEARVGGLGLMLVRRVTRSVSYERTSDARNRLTLHFAGADG